MAATVECVLRVQNQLGESPLWHPQEGALYWIDFSDTPRLYRWQPESRQAQVFLLPVAVSAVAWRQAGGLVAATLNGVALWRQESGLSLLADPEAGDRTVRLNDAAVDRQGRFWVGSMKVNAAISSLFRYDPNGTLQRMDNGFTLSNGIGWSPDGLTMYFTDSQQHVIYAYDFDPQSGEISNRRVLVTTSNEPGVPDGLGVDSQGGLWSVFCRGWKVVRYTPEGRKEMEIRLPVECPTSCAFGGPDMATLYVTSSWGLIRESERRAQPLAGDLFSIQTGYQGNPEPAFTG